MAQPESRRKGWRAALRYVGLLVLAIVIAFPVSFIGGIMLTPVLWKLEPVLGMELAGHSGPSDWILETIFGILTIGVYALLLLMTRRRGPFEPPDAQRERTDNRAQPDA